MKLFRVNSLQAKVVITFIVVVLVISTVFNLFIYMNDRNQKIQDLNELAAFTASRLSKNFIAPMWDMELDKLNDIIRFEMGEKQIFSIIVMDAEDKKMVAGARRDENWKIVDAGGTIQKDFIELVKPIERDGEKLGVMHVYFTSLFLDKELRRILTNTSMLFLILAVILIVVLFVVLRKLVINPVKEVVALTEKLNNGDLSARLKAGKDEIGEMVQAINDFANNLQQAIKHINLSMKAVARGDLTEQISINLRGDLSDLKTSINNSIGMLGQTISEVVNSTDRVKTGSGEISSSANTLANGTTQQAAAIEEMTSLINEFSSQTKANNDNAAQAQQLSNQSLEIVQRGNQQMESMLKSINEINNTSNEVSKVIKVIDEIAFQTNLLALNAAVEAARAGKYGKGFAVVAEEVRSLASRSAEAAKSTTQLIEASIHEVDKGVKNADLTAAVLNEISESIDKTNDLVGEISSASQEQAAGIDEINRGLTQVNDIVQQNSSISEETASSSEELSGQAIQLEKLMGKFQLARKAATPEPKVRKKEIVAAKTYKPKPEKLVKESPKQITPPAPAAKDKPELDFKPQEVPVNKKRNILVLDDDEFGKY